MEEYQIAQDQSYKALLTRLRSKAEEEVIPLSQT
jgi:hypothetical protein